VENPASLDQSQSKSAIRGDQRWCPKTKSRRSGAARRIAGPSYPHQRPGRIVGTAIDQAGGDMPGQNLDGVPVSVQGITVDVSHGEALADTGTPAAGR